MTNPTAGLSLLFEDDFKGPKGSPPGPAWSLYTATYAAWARRPSQIVLDGSPDGHVVITAENSVGTIITGGMAAEMPKPLLHGYVECRAQLQSDPTGLSDTVALLWPDDGIWPAHGEIDYMETTAIGRNPVGAYAHYGADNQFAYGLTNVDGTRWHNYGALWTADGVTRYVDGVVTPWQSAPPPASGFQWSMHPTLQLDFNTAKPGDQLRAPVRMRVDWLRVYA